MPQAKRAAIDLDEISTRQLGEVTAADFLAALHAGGLSAGHLTVWPEKKKVELWLEPEDFRRIQVGPIINVIRVEKKKRELEFDPWLPGDPVRTLPDILTRLARDLEARSGAR